MTNEKCARCGRLRQCSESRDKFGPVTTCWICLKGRNNINPVPEHFDGARDLP